MILYLVEMVAIVAMVSPPPGSGACSVGSQCMCSVASCNYLDLFGWLESPPPWYMDYNSTDSCAPLCFEIETETEAVVSPTAWVVPLLFLPDAKSKVPSMLFAAAV